MAQVIGTVGSIEVNGVWIKLNNVPRPWTRDPGLDEKEPLVRPIDNLLTSKKGSIDPWEQKIRVQVDADEAGVECVAGAGGAGEGAQVQVGGGRRPAAAPRARALGAQSLVSSRGRRVARPAVRRRRRADSDRLQGGVTGEWLWRARRGPCRGDDAARSARHALLTWHAAAPPSLRWQLSQHSPGVVCALRKGVCRAAYKGARKCRPGSRTPPRLRPESEAYEGSVNIPEAEGTATGAHGATPRSSTHSGAAGSR
ncbi:unnamed protein product [Spodoptera exigua]|nr:unnamed protein product [Spodoptera exigua]